jgi:TRAP-type mannitol/chloroaromatic compound transport system permease small subunit
VKQLLRLARSISTAGVWAGGALLALTAVLIGVEVLIRKLLNMSTGGADEVSGMALAVATAWALPLALLDRAHIRIDSLYGLMPIRVAAVLDILGLLAFALFFGHIAWYGWGVFATSLRLGSVSLSAMAVPLAVPQAIWAAGMTFFVATIALLLIRALMLLASGDAEGVVRIAGSRTALEETAEELRDLDRRTTEQ